MRPITSPTRTASGAPVSSNVTATATSAAPAPASPFVRPSFPTNTTEELIVLTNDDARYTFTSLGGGVKTVELLKFPETVSRRSKSAPTNDLATLNAHAELPVLAVLGGEACPGRRVFSLTRTANGVRAEKTLANGLRLVKEFHLSTNYLVHASVRLENTSSQRARPAAAGMGRRHGDPDECGGQRPGGGSHVV